jgi:flagellar basal body-associated protein FliL
MAKNEKEAPGVGPDGQDPNAIPSQPIPVIPLLNSIAILATAGFFIYSSYYFKRPAITEQSERDRLSNIHASPTPPPIPAYIPFESVTVNIEAVPDRPMPADGTTRQLQGKLHYVTLAFSLEIRDSNFKEIIEAVRPLILDKLILTVGKKSFQDLTTVQGRYVLHSQIMDFSNQLINTHSAKPMKEGLVTNVYFTNFIVQ